MVALHADSGSIYSVPTPASRISETRSYGELISSQTLEGAYFRDALYDAGLMRVDADLILRPAVSVKLSCTSIEANGS